MGPCLYSKDPPTFTQKKKKELFLHINGYFCPVVYNFVVQKKKKGFLKIFFYFRNWPEIEASLLTDLVKILQRTRGPSPPAVSTVPHTHPCSFRHACTLGRTATECANNLLLGLADNLETKITDINLLSSRLTSPKRREPNGQVYSSNFHGDSTWSSCCPLHRSLLKFQDRRQPF